LRKDPLDPIDSGTKVAILFKRLTDPEFAKREEEMKKRQVGGSSDVNASTVGACVGMIILMHACVCMPIRAKREEEAKERQVGADSSACTHP
jgi:hypothetical protein